MCFLGGLMLNVECQVSPFVYGTAPREPRHGFAIWLPSVGCGPVKKEGIQWLSWKTPWIEPRKMLRFLGDIIWYNGYINLARYIVYTVWVFSSNADLIGALFIREDDPKKKWRFFQVFADGLEPPRRRFDRIQPAWGVVPCKHGRGNIPMKNPAILPSIQPTKKEESYVFFFHCRVRSPLWQIWTIKIDDDWIPSHFLLVIFMLYPRPPEKLDPGEAIVAGRRRS